MSSGLAVDKNSLSHADQTALPNADALPDAAITADKGPVTYIYTAVHRRPCRDMTVVSDHNIVLNQRLTVDDAVAYNDCPCINDGAMHHYRAWPQHGMG